ncbi:hypothetical protein [Rubripirellula reticaptiva]|uniref:Uncharacterized protein n=1 Tax=Rubripirellula reticaptiva TaxID=2528013 RepID=A0A5C6FBX5_9BACT|nr:hypothetical protein [Rubripirellula reticaptiva]TWU57109.1 hypothetical protein Poly59_00140 [Rubripirellula reticaptiva]
MKRSLALSLLAALSGSTFAEPTSAATSHSNRTSAAQTQTAENSDLSEKQRIMVELRRQVGSELSER